MKKKAFLTIGLIAIGIAIITTGCEGFGAPSVPKASVSSVSVSQNTGIWVTGEGSVSVVPDIAILSLGVEAQEDTVGAAQSQAATAMDAVVRELRDNGIADKDISTQHFSISPVRRWVPEKEREELLGYRVNNMATVKVRNVEDIGEIIDDAARAAGDLFRVNNISFTVEDPAKYYEEAREKAMADAEAKAKQLADAAGVRLDQPTYINESGGVPIVRDFGVKSYAEAAPTTPISPGETEIRLSVQVVYGIR